MEDADAVFRIIDSQRDYLEQWLPWVARTHTVIPLRQYIRESIRFNSGGQRLTWFIWYDGRIVGSVGLVQVDRHNRAGEIGYWLSQHAQGRGIMTRATEALVRYAFISLQLHRLVIKAPVDNHRSRAVAERLGFQLEGILRHALYLRDAWFDLALYSCLREGWLAAQQEE